MKIPYPFATIGTLATLIVAFVLNLVAQRAFDRGNASANEKFRRRKFATTIIVLLAVGVVAAFWGRLFAHKGTFFGLIGAGLAVALREPLLAIAGRIAIFAGHMYTVGDRIEISNMAGDVIDVGFFYTRLLEIGNWIKGDQTTGRITQFSNSIVFQNPVQNYTQNFSYIWDEVSLPITYTSNLEEATRILLAAAEQYTREFMQTAEQELQNLTHQFLVPSVELKPSVYTQITDNYILLTMRYIVDPKKRRGAKSFINERVLKMLKGRKDISFGSTTMDLTLHRADGEDRRAA